MSPSELTLHAMLSERYRQAYLHDMRGGLQAIRNSLELIVRTMKTAQLNPAAMEKAADLARRALAGHEKVIEQTVDRLILRDEPAVAVDLAALLRELLGFLQNTIAARGLPVQFEDAGNISVSAQPGRLRLVLLALLSTAIDFPPQLTALYVTLQREANDVYLELPGGNAFEHVDAEPGDSGWGADARRLTWSVARQFLEANGGSLARRDDGPAAGIVRIGYPLCAS